MIPFLLFWIQLTNYTNQTGARGIKSEIKTCSAEYMELSAQTLGLPTACMPYDAAQPQYDPR